MEWVRCEDEDQNPGDHRLVHVYGDITTLGHYGYFEIGDNPIATYGGLPGDDIRGFVLMPQGYRLQGVTHWKPIEKQGPPEQPPEAHINILIATEVMGYHLGKCCGDQAWIKGKGDQESVMALVDQWHPDTNGAQAWQVLDKMAEAGWWYKIQGDNRVDGPFVTVEIGKSMGGWSHKWERLEIDLPTAITKVVGDIIAKAKAEGRSVT